MGQLIGDEQVVHFLQPVTLRGPSGEALDLGYRTTNTFFLLGVGMKRQGYVLVPQGDYRHFFTLSDAEIKEYQAQGALPKPLPEYHPSLGALLGAYSFWLALVVALAWPFYNWLQDRKKRRLATSGASSAQDHHNVIRTERID